MKNKSEVVVIVDAYSAGNLFAREIAARGYRLVHVQSADRIPTGYQGSFRPADFEENLVFDGDRAKLLSALRERRPRCVIAGSELGVLLADYLSHGLGLATNGVELTECRRDKYRMLERAREAGVAVPKQIRSDRLDEILRWARAETAYPIVLKPINSAGTDAVFICRDAQETTAAFEAIFSKVNKLNFRNDHVLAQEYLDGAEFAVNSVSLEGRHYISSIWHNKKAVPPGGGPAFYDQDDLLARAGAAVDEASEYARSVLDALGIAIGPGHLEIMMTKDGPRLIEMGARISGATLPDVDLACIGHGQIDLTVDAYLDPARFREKTRAPYELKKRAAIITLRSTQAGTIKSVPRFESLKGYFTSRIKVKIGDQAQITRDVFSSPGFVCVISERPEDIASDYRTVRALEKEGLFELA